MVNMFIKYGGDENWISTGLDELPEALKKLSQASYQMAYDFNINVLEQICMDLGKITEDSNILQALEILSYFQFLACVTLVFGIVPENSTPEKKFLSEIPFIKPSPESFETMKNASNKESRYEN